MAVSSASPDPTSTLSAGQKARFAVLTLLVFTAVVEGMARLVIGVSDPVSVPFDQVEPFLPDPSDPAWVITNPRLGEPNGPEPVIRPQRFAARKAPGTFRVLIVGGSSMYQMYAERDRGLNEAIAAGAGVPPSAIELIGGGANSQGSDGDRRIVEALLPYDLDVVVVYSGHNEYTQHFVNLVAAQGGHGVDAVIRASAALQLVQRGVDRWRLARIEAARALPAVSPGMTTTPVAGPEGPTGAAPRGGHVVSLPELVGVPSAGRVPVGARAAAFDANLRAIVEASRAVGTQVVLLTVPSNLVAPAWPRDTPPERLTAFAELQRQGRYEDAAAIAVEALSTHDHIQSTPVENAVIEAVAADTQATLVDVRAAVSAAEPHGVAGETLLGDHCHLNAEGRQVWIAQVAPVIGGLLAARGAAP